MIGRARAVGVMAIAILFAVSSAIAVHSPRVEVVLEGNQALSTRDVLAELGDWVADVVADPTDEGARDDLAYEIAALYRAAGFERCTVDTEIRARDADTDVVFRIHEGPRRILADITMVGNSHFPLKRLVERFQWQRAGALAPLGGGETVYSEDVWQSGRAAIVLVYRLEGFLDVALERELSERVQGNCILVDLHVKITEGPRYRVGEIRTSATDADVRAACGLDESMVFTPRIPVEVERRIMHYYNRRGHYRPRVEVESTRRGTPNPRDHVPRIDLDVTIDPGPIADIGEIRIEGATHTRTSWIRAHLDFEEGSRFDQSALDRGRDALLESGLFERVDITIAPQVADPGRVIVTITIGEKDRLMAAFKLGFGSYELARVGVELQHRNIFGRGIKTKLEGAISVRGEESTATIEAPLFAKADLSLRTTIGYRRFVEPTFTRQQSLARASLSKKLRQHLEAQIGYELRDVNVIDAERSVPDEFDDDSRSALLFSALTHDSRDSFFAPTRGVVTSAKIEHADRAYGSTLNFVRLSARYTHVFSLSKRVQLVGNGRGAWIHSLNSDVIPLGERLFLGGARTMRAFTRDDMGPKDSSDNAIGGQAYLLGNLELRYPIWKNFRGALFVDAGQLVANDSDLLSKGERVGVGGGLMFQTPVGPIRVDAAVNVNPRDEEDDWAIQFLLGHPF